MDELQTCIDCSAPIKVSPCDGAEEFAYLCHPCYQERFAHGKFDSVPTSLNFSKQPMKLTIHGRIARTGCRVYEQAQDGLVTMGRRG